MFTEKLSLVWGSKLLALNLQCLHPLPVDHQGTDLLWDRHQDWSCDQCGQWQVDPDQGVQKCLPGFPWPVVSALVVYITCLGSHEFLVETQNRPDVSQPQTATETNKNDACSKAPRVNNEYKWKGQ